MITAEPAPHAHSPPPQEIRCYDIASEAILRPKRLVQVEEEELVCQMHSD